MIGRYRRELSVAAAYGFILLLMVVSPSMGLPLMGIIGYPIDLITHYWAGGLRMVIGS